jgi:hypothetical protein
MTSKFRRCWFSLTRINLFIRYHITFITDLQINSLKLCESRIHFSQLITFSIGIILNILFSNIKYELAIKICLSMQISCLYIFCSFSTKIYLGGHAMNFITRHLDEKYINLKCDFSKKKAAIKFEQEFKFLPVGFPKLEKKYVFLSLRMWSTISQLHV